MACSALRLGAQPLVSRLQTPASTRGLAIINRLLLRFSYLMRGIYSYEVDSLNCSAHADAVLCNHITCSVCNRIPDKNFPSLCEMCRWAAGLERAATLLLGDISFLHDINGLNLLRTGEQRAMTGPQHPRNLDIFHISF